MDKEEIIKKTEALISTKQQQNIELVFQLADSQEVYNARILKLWAELVNKKIVGWRRGIFLKQSDRYYLDLSHKGIDYISSNLSTLTGLISLDLGNKSFNEEERKRNKKLLPKCKITYGDQ